MVVLRRSLSRSFEGKGAGGVVGVFGGGGEGFFL